MSKSFEAPQSVTREVNVADLIGILRSKGGLFEQWGNALGEPSPDAAVHLASLKLTRRQKEAARAKNDARSFEPTKEECGRVVTDIERALDVWIVENQTTKDQAFDVWSKILHFLQGLGRPRLYQALERAISERLLGD